MGFVVCCCHDNQQKNYHEVEIHRTANFVVVLNNKWLFSFIIFCLLLLSLSQGHMGAGANLDDVLLITNK